jgi:hypothetical protein
MIVAMEIRRCDQTRAQVRYLDAVATCHCNGARIGRAADVPFAGTRGIDLNIQPEPFRLATKGSLGEGRAADVAETDEQHGYGHA